MQLVPVVTWWLVLLALGQAKEYRKLGAEYVPAESGKASLDEPSCEELRAMWRFSKRQSRAAEITNEIPQYRDPFVYNIWEPYPGSSGVGIAGGNMGAGLGLRTKGILPVAGRRQRPVYGRIVHTPPPGIASLRTMENSGPLRMRAFDEVIRMFGGARPAPATAASPRKTFRYSGLDAAMPIPQAGSFQQLKELVKAERAREIQQRFAEDQASMAEYGRVMHGPPSRDDTAFGSLRFGRFEEPRPRAVLAFPDVLAPAARMDDYVFMDPPGFTTTDDAYVPSGEMMPFSSEVDPLPVKTKHRSSVTKGRRVYASAPRNHGNGGGGGGGFGHGSSSTYPLAESPQPSCSEIEDHSCTTNTDCECTEGGLAASEAGLLYRCSINNGFVGSTPVPTTHDADTTTGRCQLLLLAGTENDEFGTWHASPLESSHLGIWHRRKRSNIERRTRLRLVESSKVKKADASVTSSFSFSNAAVADTHLAKTSSAAAPAVFTSSSSNSH